MTLSKMKMLGGMKKGHRISIARKRDYIGIILLRLALYKN